ncbi:arsenic transporter [Bacillaceae bacterium]
MPDIQTGLTFVIFLLTVVFMLWRPFGINEYVPTSLAAAMIFLLGIVPLSDVFRIAQIVSGASITILSTIVMSIVLDSIGFFRWASFNLARRSNGSGYVLYWSINLLCFTMTLFFNNDGSILITTPIILQTLTLLNLKPHEKIPYLVSGALIATASSAPIGVSNLANLIALNIVGLDLNSYAMMMFVPSMLGIVTIAILIFLFFKNDIPKEIPVLPKNAVYLFDTDHRKFQVPRNIHPLAIAPYSQPAPDWQMFRTSLLIVVLVRMSFFALAPLGIPPEIPAVIGAILLLALRWHRTGEKGYDVVKKTPWHILIFAFSMYVVIYGLHNVGLTSVIVEHLGDKVSSSPFHAIFIMGLLLTFLSNLCNNLPSIMIGTLSLTSMQLDLPVLQAAYLTNVIGADIGALLLPTGTLATLIWLFILKQNRIALSWAKYLKVTLFVIPVGLLVSLTSLFLWLQWLIFS